jgi:acyl carrier protein
VNSTTDVLEGVIQVIADTLGVGDRAAGFDAGTPLLNSMPELDSMAIVQLIVALEDHFGIEVDEDEITSEVFDTIGTLATFVASQS